MMFFSHQGRAFGRQGKERFFFFAACFFYALTMDLAAAEGLTPAGCVKIIHIEGPPSQERDVEAAPYNTAQWGKQQLESRYNAAFYQRIQKNLIIPLAPHLSYKQLVKKLLTNYERWISSRLADIQIRNVVSENFEYIYPSGYAQNQYPVRVKARRLTIQVHLPDERHRRQIVAYFLNYDKASSEEAVLFIANGHFGHNPSRQAIGLEQKGGLSGAATGKLALLGIPLVTYDDSRDNSETPSAPGESFASDYRRPGLIHTLEDLKVIDLVLLQKFSRVDALGLSGGAERLFHFLMMHTCPLRSTYLAGWATPLWIKGDAREHGSPFGFDPDAVMFDYSLSARIQLADMVLVGLSRGVRIAFAQNPKESGLSKAGLLFELVPTLRRYTNDFEIRGGDRDGDGFPDGEEVLAHEYDLPDYLDFLRSVRFADNASAVKSAEGRYAK